MRQFVVYDTSTQKGFTLLEVMVAMSILAFISVATAEITSNAFRSRDLISEEIEAIHNMRIAFKIISRDIMHALHEDPPPKPSTFESYNEDKAKNRTFFQGSEHNLILTSRSHRRLLKNKKESNDSIISYSVKEDNKDEKIKHVSKREKTIIDNDPEEGGAEYTILDNVKELSFKYYDTKKEKWTESWDSRSQDQKDYFPQSVEVTLTLFDRNQAEITLTNVINIALPNNPVKM